MDAHGFIDQVMALWRDPVPPGAAGETAFGACYAPSLTVNGTPFALADLVARARTMQAAYSDIRPEVLEVVSAPDRIVVAFVMHVRHTGPLVTPLGVAEPTGREPRPGPSTSWPCATAGSPTSPWSRTSWDC
jgi:hypothetical protein